MSTPAEAVSEMQSRGQGETNIPHGCTVVRFSDWEYLPWNNSQNIVRQDVQLYAAQVRTNVLVVLFLIGGPANVINMAVFYKQGLKDRFNLLLFSLSLADEIYLLGAIFHFAEDFFAQFTTGQAGMSAYYVFFMNNNVIFLFGFCYVSLVLSTIMACERCYCVLRPLQYHAMTRTKPLAIVIVAVYVVIAALQVLVVNRFYVGCAYNADTGAVFNMFLHGEFYSRNKDLIDFIDSAVFGVGLQLGLPLVVITPTAVTAWKLRQAAAWRSGTASDTAGSVSSVKELALTRMLVGVSVLLIVCAIPNCLVRAACIFLPELNTGRRHENLFLVGIWASQTFLFINSSFNIFIYYTMGTRYRENFWALFRRKANIK